VSCVVGLLADRAFDTAVLPVYFAVTVEGSDPVNNEAKTTISSLILFRDLLCVFVCVCV